MSSWLQKLGLGLKKSSSRLGSGLNGIFKNRKIDSQTLEELEELLLVSDMGVKASARIIDGFAARKFPKDAAEEELHAALAAEIEAVLLPCQQKFSLSDARPAVILMAGVNGAGKTTAIGKLAHKFKGKKISFIAADTFRAAAVEQLSAWGERNGIRVFKGAPGCDAAGLCYDGLQEALKQKDEIVFIDTAGRLQNKNGLMDELKKIIRVIKKILPDAPQHTLLCLDAATGQNAISQVKTFKEAVNINGLIVNKLDGTAKGGILTALAAECPLPVYFIGIGEGLDDLNEFNAKDFSRNLLGI